MLPLIFIVHVSCWSIEHPLNQHFAVLELWLRVSETVPPLSASPSAFSPRMLIVFACATRLPVYVEFVVKKLSVPTALVIVSVPTAALSSDTSGLESVNTLPGSAGRLHVWSPTISTGTSTVFVGATSPVSPNSTPSSRRREPPAAAPSVKPRGWRNTIFFAVAALPNSA